MSSSYRVLEGNKTNNEAAIRGLIGRFAKAFRTKDAPEIVSFDILPPLQAEVPRRL